MCAPERGDVISNLPTAKMDKSAAVGALGRVAYFTNEEQTIINNYEEFKEMGEAKISLVAASKQRRGCWQEIGGFIICNIESYNRQVCDDNQICVSL